VYLKFSIFPGGTLVALVAISSCANHVTYWAAFLIGCLAGKKFGFFPKI
jgi:ammonia channel protein AmtB